MQRSILCSCADQHA